MKGKSYTVSGTAWGDEGKAKVVDLLVSWLLLNESLGAVIRPNGGANAGHTVVAGDMKFAFHLIPSGIFHPGVKCISGSGMVIDPTVYLQEVEDLEKLGIEIQNRLFISEKVHLTFPWHIYFERALEKAMGKDEIGTTQRGIGPTYAAKAFRSLAIRAGELKDRDALKAKFMVVESLWTKLMRGLGLTDGDIREMSEKSVHYLDEAFKLKKYLANVDGQASRMIDGGLNVLNEMAQGPLLDMDHGTYPYNTSSNTFPPYGLKDVAWSDVIVAVVKAYTTRVGGGPLVGELEGEEADRLRQRGHEFGTTTGRPRRVSWLDLVATRYSLGLMRTPHTDIQLAITKLDVLDEFPEIKVITGYRMGDIVHETMPSARPEILDLCRPEYRVIPGWQCDTTGCREMKDLPAAAQMYLHFISEQLGCPVGFVSVGADREQTIIDWQ